MISVRGDNLINDYAPEISWKEWTLHLNWVPQRLVTFLDDVSTFEGVSSSF